MKYLIVCGSEYDEGKWPNKSFVWLRLDGIALQKNNNKELLKNKSLFLYPHLT